MIFADNETFFMMMFFIALLFFMALAAWKKSSGLYLFSGFMGIGFLYYATDNYTVDEGLMWLIALITLGAILLGFLQKR